VRPTPTIPGLISETGIVAARAAWASPWRPAADATVKVASAKAAAAVRMVMVINQL
jgi:hypothetical protein